MKFLIKAQNAGIATLLLSASIFISRFIGLLRDKLISWQFGATIETDMYFIAFILPDFINYLLAGGYFSILLVPLLTQYFTKGEKEGYAFFSSVLFAVTIAILSLTILLWICTPLLVPLIAPKYSLEEYARITLFIRIILPGQVFFLTGTVFSALLYMRKQFAVPALSPLIYNIAIVAFGMLFSQYGMIGYCYGVTIGAFVGGLLLPIYAVCRGGFSLQWTLKHKGLLTFILLALPLMLGQSITVLEEQLVRIFASYLPSGVVSMVSYARRIMLLPVGVVAQAIGVASYPFLASMIAQGNIAGFIKILHDALRNTLYFLLPITAFMFFTAEETLAIVFYGGEFTQNIVEQTAPLLQMLLLGVPAWAIQQMLARGFYANNDTIRPTVVGTLCTLASFPIYYYAVTEYGAVGVAFASTLVITIYMLVLSLVWRKYYYKGVLQGLFSSTCMTILELLPAVAVLFAIKPHMIAIFTITFTDSYFIRILCTFSIYACVFILFYGLTLYLANSARLQFFLSFIRRRL